MKLMYSSMKGADVGNVIISFLQEEGYPGRPHPPLVSSRSVMARRTWDGVFSHYALSKAVDKGRATRVAAGGVSGNGLAAIKAVAGWVMTSSEAPGENGRRCEASAHATVEIVLGLALQRFAVAEGIFEREMRGANAKRCKASP